MRIPLLTSLNREELTYLNNAVVLTTPRKIITTDFIVDTGSPETILGYTDALRLQIPLNNLPKTNIIGIGGRKHQGYKYNRLTFKFHNEEGGIVSEEFPVTIVKPTSEKDNVTEIPTIIGMDFLKNKKYVLFCDVAGEKAYLEKKE
jgi:hypothetical protein